MPRETFEEHINRLKNDPNVSPMYCKRCKRTWEFGKPGKLCPICRSMLVFQNEKLPECPTCHSKNIVSVSQTKREFSVFLFGIANPTARAQFECKNCGYKW